MSAHADAPIEIPGEILERVGTICLALPEVTVRVDESLVRRRSAAHSFDIRRRSFCLLMATEGRPARLPDEGGRRYVAAIRSRMIEPRSTSERS